MADPFDLDDRIRRLHAEGHGPQEIAVRLSATEERPSAAEVARRLAAMRLETPR